MSGVKAIKDKGVGGKWFWDLDEFTRGQALAEADAEPKTIKERVEERREKHKESSEEKD